MEDEFAGYPGVIVQPGRVGGKPTLGESRVPAALVAECLDEGDAAEDVAYNYSLPLRAVLDFKTYREARHAAIRP